MRVLTLTLLTLASLTATAQDKAEDKPAAAELRKLTGEWKCVALRGQDGDAPAAIFRQFTAVVKDDTISGTVIGGETFTARLVIDPTTSPMRLTLRHTDGAFKGEDQPAVFVVVGEYLLICASEPGTATEKAPKSLTDLDPTNGLYVFERTKSKQ